MNGTVSEFDDTVGLGVIVTSDGESLPFHCIEIADGSRTIPVGTAVTFRLLPRFGSWQAADIAPT